MEKVIKVFCLALVLVSCSNDSKVEQVDQVEVSAARVVTVTTDNLSTYLKPTTDSLKALSSRITAQDKIIIANLNRHIKDSTEKAKLISSLQIENKSLKDTLVVYKKYGDATIFETNGQLLTIPAIPQIKQDILDIKKQLLIRGQ